MGRDREYWDRRAQQYGNRAAGYLDSLQFEYEERLRWAAFRRMVPLTGREAVLDAGCGVGRWSTRIADFGCTVTGVDLSATMIGLAKPHERVRYIVSGIEDLELQSESYDLIVSITVLQHITEDRPFNAAVTAVHRLLRPGGHAFILEHSTLGPRVEPPGERYMRYRPYQEWCRTFEDAGFIVESTAGVRFVDQRSIYLADSLDRRVRRLLGQNEKPNGAGMLRVLITNAACGIDLAIARIPLLNSLSDVHAFYLRRSDS